MDLSPAIPAGRQVIESYGEGRVRIAGVVWSEPVLVTPSFSQAWTHRGPLAEEVVETLAPLFTAEFRPELLLIGCGLRAVLLPGRVRQRLKDQFGVVVETMDTGAACRTYAVLMGEDRRVAAALIPV